MVSLLILLILFHRRTIFKMLALEHSAENGHFITGEGVVRLLPPALAMSLPSVKFILAAVAVTASVFSPWVTVPVSFCLNGGLHSLSALYFIQWFNSLLNNYLCKYCCVGPHYITWVYICLSTRSTQWFYRYSLGVTVTLCCGQDITVIMSELEKERLEYIANSKQQVYTALMLLLLPLLYED